MATPICKDCRFYEVHAFRVDPWRCAKKPDIVNGVGLSCISQRLAGCGIDAVWFEPKKQKKAWFAKLIGS